jgi:TMEM175 potassium channel family protein
LAVLSCLLDQLPLDRTRLGESPLDVRPHQAGRPSAAFLEHDAPGGRFLPFPTQLLAQALRLRADLSTAAFVYGLVLTIGGLFFNGIWLYAIRHPSLMSEKTPERYLHQVKRRFLIGPASYGLATVFALVAPAVSVVCYAILIVYFWLPPRGETSATSG